MGRKSKDTTIEVFEGVYLYRKDNTPNYQCYFSVNGKKHRYSTKTKNLSKAKEFALEASQKAVYKSKLGISSERITFKKLADLYLHNQRASNNYKAETIERHFKEFFKKFSDVNEIKTSDIDEYISYRKDKSKKVSNSTLDRENTVLRQLFSFANKRGYLLKEITVEPQSKKEDKKRRPHFTEDQYKKLVKESRLRSSKKRCNHKRTFWNRQLLRNIILILANTGLRVDEMNKIRWKDIDFKEEIIRLDYVGKTRSNRPVVIGGKYGIIALKRLRAARINYLKENGSDTEIVANEFVQSLPDGTHVKSLKKSFTSLLAACNFGDQGFCLTSLRHTFGTFRLQSENVDVYRLAKQMGTSIRMIEQHYGHNTAEDFKESFQNYG